MRDRTDPSAIRILHVVNSMARAGLETWLMNVMRRIDRERFRFDFCTATDRECDYDEEIRALGGTIIPCVWNHNILRFNHRFSRILREGRYDVVHAHAYGFAGVVLRAAAGNGVRHRFAHLHTTGDGKHPTLPRRVYRGVMRHWVNRHATRILGCAAGALDAFFPAGWKNDPRMRVVYYGVDLRPFEAGVDREGVRRELELTPETPLLIHVGSFTPQKNHRRLIEIFDAVRTLRGDVHLTLIGIGPLLDGVRRQVRAIGLEERVHFLGSRSDVPRLMQAADVMVMPSVREGMPVTMIEAGAAGLPIVITEMPGIREATEIGCEATLLALDRPNEVWANAVIEALDSPRPSPAEALSRMTESPFSSEVSARTMEAIYHHDAG